MVRLYFVCVPACDVNGDGAAKWLAIDDLLEGYVIFHYKKTESYNWTLWKLWVVGNKVKSSLCIALKTRLGRCAFGEAISAQILWDGQGYPLYSAVSTVNPRRWKVTAWGSTRSPWFMALPWKRMTVPLSDVCPWCKNILSNRARDDQPKMNGVSSSIAVWLYPL